MGNTNSSESSFPEKCHRNEDIDRLTLHRGRSLLDDLRDLEQKITAIHQVQERQATILSGNNTAQESGATVIKEPPTEFILHGVGVKPGSAKVVVGPVIGKVTQDSARVLLEVDREATVTCHASTVSDECPSGCPAATDTLRMTAGRPMVFNLRGLKPSSQIRITFSGVTVEDATTRTGRFKTLPMSDDGSFRGLCVSKDEPGTPLSQAGDLAVGAEATTMWRMVQRELQTKDIHCVFHLGGQVDCGVVFQECAMLLPIKGLKSTDGDEAFPSHDESQSPELLAVKQRLRDMYRLSWNLPGKREVLASCGNLMIWGERELTKGFASATDAWGNPLPIDLLHLSQLVYREYQRALWDETVIEEEYNIPWGTKGSGNEECHFHMFGGLGVLFLDTIGGRLLPDGSQQLTNPFISQNQWEFLDFVLRKRELRRLVLVTDSPVTSRELCTTNETCLGNKSASVSCWDSNDQDQVKLIETIVNWKRDNAPADAVLFCGGGQVGNTVYLKHNKIRSYMLHQVTTGPLTAPYHAPTQLALFEEDEMYDQHKVTSNEGGNTGVGRVFSPSTTPTQVVIHPLVGIGNSFMSFVAPLTKQKGNFPIEYNLLHSHMLQSDTGASLAPEPLQAHSARIVLGPVIGKVTCRAAVVLIELDQQSVVSCTLRDTVTLREHTKCRPCPGGVPCTFVFNSLEPERRYIVSFGGRIKEDSTRTGLVCTSVSQQIGEQSTRCRPNTIAIVADDTPTSLSGEARKKTNQDHAFEMLGKAVHPIWGGITTAIHIGGQVDLTLAFQQINHYLRCTCDGITPDELSLTRRVQVESALVDILRSAYRFTWNLPGKRKALATCSNLMIRGEKDILFGIRSIMEKKHDWGESEGKEPVVGDEEILNSNDKANKTESSTSLALGGHQSPVPSSWVPTVSRLAQSMYREYQRQLWDVDVEYGILGRSANPSSMLGEQFSHTLNDGQVGIICLDLLAQVIDSAGRTKAASTSENDQVLNAGQWDELETLLSSEGFTSDNMSVLIITTEYPIVMDSSSDARVKQAMGIGRESVSPWTLYSNEREHILQILFEWKLSCSNKSLQREVLIVAGGQGTSFTTTIRQLGQVSRTPIRQLCCGPSTGQVKSFDAEVEGVLDGEVEFEYRHKAPNAGQRGFGIASFVPNQIETQEEFRMDLRVITCETQLPQVTPSDPQLPAWVTEPVNADAKVKLQSKESTEQDDQIGLAVEEAKAGEMLETLGTKANAAESFEKILGKVQKVMDSSKTELETGERSNVALGPVAAVLGAETAQRLEEMTNLTRDSDYIVTLEKAFHRYADDAFMTTSDFIVAAQNYIEEEATSELRTVLFAPTLQHVTGALNSGSIVLLGFAVQVAMQERSVAASKRGEDAHLPITSVEFGRLIARVFAILILVRPALEGN